MNAIILAGGQSSRYGSNKALINFSGKTIIEHITARLKTHFNRIYIVGNNDTDYSFAEGVTVVNDIIPGKGPLGGLYTGLVSSDACYNLMTACDMPFISDDYLDLLKAQKKDYNVLIAEYKDYIEPLPGIYSQDCLPAVEQSLRSSQLKIKSFFSEVKVKLLKEEEIEKIEDLERLFYNINFKADANRAREIMNNRER